MTIFNLSCWHFHPPHYQARTTGILLLHPNANKLEVLLVVPSKRTSQIYPILSVFPTPVLVQVIIPFSINVKHSPN